MFKTGMRLLMRRGVRGAWCGGAARAGHEQCKMRSLLFTRIPMIESTTTPTDEHHRYSRPLIIRPDRQPLKPTDCPPSIDADHEPCEGAVRSAGYAERAGGVAGGVVLRCQTPPAMVQFFHAVRFCPPRRPANAVEATVFHVSQNAAKCKGMFAVIAASFLRVAGDAINAATFSAPTSTCPSLRARGGESVRSRQEGAFPPTTAIHELYRQVEQQRA